MLPLPFHDVKVESSYNLFRGSIIIEARVPRRMAAILAADVVGYSNLMNEDEEATLAALKKCRAAADPLISSHHGRIFGSAGDSLVVEFASPVEAVRCAMEIQSSLKRLNEDLPDERRMLLRIGINLGDVMDDEGNLMGDGVNIAARLEGLADPGGVCVSKAVLDHVADKLDFG
ncbi:MAG: adenylate/guanylate cyclase domain-containing protein, partial [Pseudomonadota bacterium]